MTQQQGNECRIAIGEEYKLEANLTIPLGSKAIILFAHGSGSSRHSTRNQHAARVLNHTGFATLLVDLLTTEEKQIDETSRHLRFDIDLLARRIMEVTEWLTRDPRTKSLRIGYFASSTGAAAAMIAAAKHNDVVNSKKTEKNTTLLHYILQ